MKTLDGPVTTRVRHGGEVAGHTMVAILKKIGIETFTRRDRFRFGTKVAIPVFIAGMFIGRNRGFIGSMRRFIDRNREN